MNVDNQKKLQKANSLYEKGDFQSALPIYEELYGQEDDPKLIINYARVLYETKQYILAGKIAQSEHEIFTKQDPPAFVKIMLAADRPIDARLFIAELPLQQQTLLKKEVASYEKQMSTEKTASLRELSRSFSHLGDFSFHEQETRYKLATGLPLKDYLLTATFVLRDPYVNPIIKSSIIKDLSTLDIDEKMTMYWIDGKEHSFNPNEVVSLQKNQTMNQVLELINQAYSQDDPQSLKIYSETFKLQMLFVYPFIEKAVKNPYSWFRALISQPDQNNSADLAALNWQKKIEKLIFNLAK